MSIANPEVVVNGAPLAIVPNSCKFDEGQPKKNIRAAAVGNTIVQDFSQDIEEAFSKFSFQLLPSVDNINLVRELQILNNTNLVTITGTETVLGVEKQLIRTFNNAAITNEPEVNLGSDGVIDVEWMSDAAV